MTLHLFKSTNLFKTLQYFTSMFLGIILLQSIVSKMTGNKADNICLNQMDVINKYFFCGLLENRIFIFAFIFMLNLLLTYLLFTVFDRLIKEALKNKPKLKNLTNTNGGFMCCPLGFGKIDRGCNFIEETLLPGENDMMKDLLSGCCPHNANKNKTKEEIKTREENKTREKIKTKEETNEEIREETKEDKIKNLFTSGMDLLKNFDTITKSGKGNIGGNDDKKDRSEEILEPLLKFFNL